MADLREQFLERLTRELFLRRGDGFVLKGGAALQALFGDLRLTKDVDLDFTNPRRTAQSLHKTVARAIDAALGGLPAREIQVSRPGKGEASPRWKVNFRDPDNRPVHVEIEVSRDASRVPPGRVVQQRVRPRTLAGVPAYWVDLYEGAALMATKIAALLARSVPRDVYDLDLLIGSVDPPGPDQIAWALNHAGVDDAPVDVLWANLDGLTWERFETELRDALPDSVVERIDTEEWEGMKLRVGEYVESLLPAGSDEETP